VLPGRAGKAATEKSVGPPAFLGVAVLPGREKKTAAVASTVIPLNPPGASGRKPPSLLMPRTEQAPAVPTSVSAIVDSGNAENNQEKQGAMENPRVSAAPASQTANQSSIASTASGAGATVHSLSALSPPAPSEKKPDRSIAVRAAYQIRLGDAYMNLGDYDRALQSFTTALALAPNNSEAYRKLKRARLAQAAERDILQ